MEWLYTLSDYLQTRPGWQNAAFRVLLTLGCIGLAYGLLRRRTTLTGRIRARFVRLAERPLLPYFLTAGLALALCAAFESLYRPVPYIHDEFGYLLGADTFLHGRVTNPTHPLWHFFESFHLVHVPHYVTKYPAGPALALALGQWLFSDPLVGVWLSYAAAQVALLWLLRGYLPSHWALAGSLVWTMHSKLLTAWGLSYWGGALAMLGGCLLWGAVPRLRRKPAVADALALASGILVLANSRPFEGALTAVPAALALGYLFWRSEAKSRWLSRVAVPAGLLLAAGLVVMGTYHARITGRPTKLPYTLYNAQYETARSLLFQTPNPRPVYRHEVMARFHDTERMLFDRRRNSVAVYLHDLLRVRTAYYAMFFLNIYLALSFFAFVLLRKSRRDAYLIGTMAFVFVVASASLTYLPHYLAPLTGLIAYASVQGTRRLLHDAPVGTPLLRRAVVLGLLGMVGIQTLTTAVRWVEPIRNPVRFRSPLQARLHGLGGRHLILVRYAPGHDFALEWVFNGADLENAAVLWARDGGTENGKLLDYYPDRTIWHYEPDRHPARLIRQRAALVSPKPVPSGLVF
jgi:hypothetical protein